MKRFLDVGPFVLLVIFGVCAWPTPMMADERQWPHPVPCRIEDGDDTDLFIITLGDVETPLAQGTFDPAQDVVTLNDGTRIENYYREKLGVEFYRPIDKSIFPLPPSGWCTWYYYYPNITATEVKYNARWIAENLKDYGAQYVQIDDGWQGSGGRDGGRDWSQVHPRRFPDGMQELAEAIAAEGLKPGIWLAPHGQSRRQVIDENPNVFLLDEQGESLSETWEGPFLVDPRTDEAHQYLKELFTKVKDWGYVYYKIDGQPIVVNEYANKAGDQDHELYRKTLRTIREAIGPESYLLGCWGIPTEGMGIMDGSRTGGDIVRGWSRGFMLAANATMRYYFQHNIAWYTDPDTMVLRSPLTLEQARAWATLQGLTGQALMGSDRLMDLSADRVELLRRVYPAVDARPLDLYPTSRNKPIWDLKVRHLDRSYDVVGIFNYDEVTAQQTYLNWQELGLPAGATVHVFDFWNKDYLGEWEAGMAVDVAPTSVRVLTLVPASGSIELVSTNRHITQGWVDLEELASNEAKTAFEGKSRVVRNDPYELCFAFPRGKGFAVKRATASSDNGTLDAQVANHQGWATVRWTPTETGSLTWRVEFEPADFYYYRPEPVENLRVVADGLDGATVTWNELYWLNAGYRVYLNGETLGYTPRSTFKLKDLDPSASYKVEVATVWDNGEESRRRPDANFTVADLLPTTVLLSALEPQPSERGGRFFGRGVTESAVTISGKRHEGAITARDVEYDLNGIFARFTAQVGVAADAEREAADAGKLTFIIEADGNELWTADVAPGAELVTVDVDLNGAKELRLRVRGGEQAGPRRRGRGRPRGPAPAWIEAELHRSAESNGAQASSSESP